MNGPTSTTSPSSSSSSSANSLSSSSSSSSSSEPGAVTVSDAEIQQQQHIHLRGLQAIHEKRILSPTVSPIIAPMQSRQQLNFSSTSAYPPNSSSSSLSTSSLAYLPSGTIPQLSISAMSSFESHLCISTLNGWAFTLLDLVPKKYQLVEEEIDQLAFILRGNQIKQKIISSAPSVSSSPPSINSLDGTFPRVNDMLVWSSTTGDDRVVAHSFHRSVFQKDILDHTRRETVRHIREIEVMKKREALLLQQQLLQQQQQAQQSLSHTYSTLPANSMMSAKAAKAQQDQQLYEKQQQINAIQATIEANMSSASSIAAFSSSHPAASISSALLMNIHDSALRIIIVFESGKFMIFEWNLAASVLTPPSSSSTDISSFPLPSSIKHLTRPAPVTNLTAAASSNAVLNPSGTFKWSLLTRGVLPQTYDASNKQKRRILKAFYHGESERIVWTESKCTIHHFIL